MFRGRFVRLFLLALCIAVFAGCGSGGDSGTNGVLTLTTSSTSIGGYNVVDAQASYTNTTATDFSGVPITITFTSVTESGTVGQPYSSEVKTDSGGNTPPVSVQYTPISEKIMVTVTARTGGLTQVSRLELPAAAQ